MYGFGVRALGSWFRIQELPEVCVLEQALARHRDGKPLERVKPYDDQRVFTGVIDSGPRGEKMLYAGTDP